MPTNRVAQHLLHLPTADGTTGERGNRGMSDAARRAADGGAGIGENRHPAADPAEVHANGFGFRSRVRGASERRTALLLHGFPQTSLSWHHQLAALDDAGYRGIAFDQRGYSPAARPAEVSSYAVEELVADVLAVADAFDVERFDLVGHDWGAMVAWVTAWRHPERVRTLTAVSVPHPKAFGAAFGAADDDQRQRSSYIEVFRREGGVAERALLGEDGSGDGLRRMFEATGLSADSEEVRQFVDAMLEPGAMTAALNWYRASDPATLAEVGAITVPTLFVWSTEDVAIGRSAAEATGAWVSGPFRFEVLEGVSHWIPETAPDTLSRLLVAHLGAHP